MGRQPAASPDSALLAHYAQLGQLRSSLHPLESGDFRVLLADDAAGVLAYGRRTDKQAALVVLNRSGSSRTVSVPVAGYLPEGTALAPAFGGGAATSVSGGAVSVTVPALAGVVLATEHVDLKPPAAPTGLAAQRLERERRAHLDGGRRMRPRTTSTAARSRAAATYG